ncbi:MEDS domain-containing protein [Candidatus Nitrosocosmicus sp. FF01]|uniref:MEDS domain-containing protein n=1 Tax=Candidatus Nitrosocosmicus sp. FF01 TaxID=3397670 RepID=UPI0039E951DE
MIFSEPNGINNIKTMHVEEATDALIVSPYGIHALVIYSDMITLREFCSFYAKKSIEEKNELLYLAPFYQTVGSKRQSLSEGHRSIDVQKHEKEHKSLIIADSLENYYDKVAKIFEIESILNANHKLVEYAKSLNKNGLSYLGDMGAFLFKNQIQSLIDYEFSLPTEFDTNLNLKGICLYHIQDFDRLTYDQKQKIIKHHKIAVKI